MIPSSPLAPPLSLTRLTIPADPAAVPPLRERFLQSLGSLPEREILHWKLIFSELLFNAVLHGAGNDPSRAISVEWAVSSQQVILSTRDPGNGPPDAAIQNASLPEPTEESGRGLFLITHFADELRYWRGPSGFQIEITKNYPPDTLHPPENPELIAILDELSSSYESLSAFHRLTENLIHSSDLRTFLGSSIEEFLALDPHDRIFIQGAGGMPETIREILRPANWFLDPKDAGHTLSELGALTQETVWESHEDLMRQGLDFPSLRAVSAGCVFPIVTAGTHFGALIVLRKHAAADTRFRSLGTLRTLADLCGIACANTHLSLIRDASQRNLRDFEIAVEIQKSLLPVLDPPLSHAWRVHIFQESAYTVAGDYPIARSDPDGNLFTAVIDVMGKGVSAALLASIFRTAFEMSIHLPSSAEMLERINRALCTQLGDLTMFVTCAVAWVSADGRVLDHASAGHCPTFLYRADGTRHLLEPSGPPLGLFPESSYKSETIHLNPGDRLLFITDGCYEWDRTDAASAWNLFIDWMDRDYALPPATLWQAMRERIHSTGEGQLEDDCTLLTIEILS